MEYVIRNAAEADLDGLEELERACFSLPWTREQLRGELPDERHEFLAAASADGRVLGYIGMMTVLDEGYISNVAVAPEARRRGIGRALVKEMLHLAEKRELSFVTLEVRAHNESAIELYAGEGFLPVGLRRDYYERPREDALLMTRFFQDKGREET
ncbi:MAG: ribosomal protein S18-alanine N-acetyltransferase [Oscillospiraceae bacterium]|nr:ribosomal protein S18-alanine N-acetyltransferase [Oscillospiraceae bacterium]